jgi:hypothetical protein
MSESSEPRRYLNSKDNPCPVCGSEDFSWGMPIAGKEAPGEFTYFRPDGSTWEDGDIPLCSRLCNRCGNVLFFIIDS